MTCTGKVRLGARDDIDRAGGQARGCILGCSGPGRPIARASSVKAHAHLALFAAWLRRALLCGRPVGWDRDRASGRESHSPRSSASFHVSARWNEGCRLGRSKASGYDDARVWGLLTRLARAAGLSSRAGRTEEKTARALRLPGAESIWVYARHRAAMQRSQSTQQAARVASMARPLAARSRLAATPRVG